MTPRRYVANFVLGTSPRYKVSSTVKSLLQAAMDDEELGRLIIEFQEEVQRLVRNSEGDLAIREAYRSSYERLRSPRVTRDLKITAAPEWLRPLLAAVYLKARNEVSAGRAGRLLQDPKKALQAAVARVKQVEPEFVGELLIETVAAARESEEFARALSEGAREFQSLAEETAREGGGMVVLGRPTDVTELGGVLELLVFIVIVIVDACL